MVNRFFKEKYQFSFRRLQHSEDVKPLPPSSWQLQNPSCSRHWLLIPKLISSSSDCCSAPKIQKWHSSEIPDSEKPKKEGRQETKGIWERRGRGCQYLNCVSSSFYIRERGESLLSLVGSSRRSGLLGCFEACMQGGGDVTRGFGEENFASSGNKRERLMEQQTRSRARLT